MFFRIILFLTPIYILSYHPLVKASLLPMGSHCVAYKAQKKLLLIKSVEVIGKNCSVVSQVQPDIGGLYSFKLEVPIERFESGEEERDKDVKKHLKFTKQESLYFTSEKLTHPQWQTIIKKTSPTKVSGNLNIGGKEYPVEAFVNFVKGDKGIEVDGLIKTSFNKLGMKPPKLFAGLMASVDRNLELHFHLMSDKTLGVETLLKNIQ